MARMACAMATARHGPRATRAEPCPLGPCNIWPDEKFGQTGIIRTVNARLYR